MQGASRFCRFGWSSGCGSDIIGVRVLIQSFRNKVASKTRGTLTPINLNGKFRGWLFWCKCNIEKFDVSLSTHDFTSWRNCSEAHASTLWNSISIIRNRFNISTGVESNTSYSLPSMSICRIKSPESVVADVCFIQFSSVMVELEFMDDMLQCLNDKNGVTANGATVPSAKCEFMLNLCKRSASNLACQPTPGE